MFLREVRNHKRRKIYIEKKACIQSWSSAGINQARTKMIGRKFIFFCFVWGTTPAEEGRGELYWQPNHVWYKKYIYFFGVGKTNTFFFVGFFFSFHFLSSLLFFFCPPSYFHFSFKLIEFATAAFFPSSSSVDWQPANHHVPFASKPFFFKWFRSVRAKRRKERAMNEKVLYKNLLH